MSQVKSCRSREEVKCPIFGAPKELSSVQLPTYEDVSKFYLLTRNILKPSKSDKDPTVSEIGEIVAREVENIWKKASLPTISHTRILKLIRTHNDRYLKILKPFKGRQNDQKYQEKLKNFCMECRHKLFDISTCKCPSMNCKCEKSRKVPAKEREFLEDQRHSRKLFIGNVDKKVTKVLNKRIERLEAQRKRDCTTSILVVKKSTSTVSESQEKEMECDITEDGSDGQYKVPSTTKEIDEYHNKSTQMRIHLPHLATMSDRYGLSDRAAAAVASAVLQDVGLISKTDHNNVIDRHKLRREREKARQSASGKPLPQLFGLFFDGRKDRTIVNEKKGDKFYKKVVMEEHISLISEPGSSFIGHTSPLSGSAKCIQRSIVHFLEEKNISTENLAAIGCDATVVNTGHKGGVIHLFEMHLGRPLQWLICMLHVNELPLRHLIQNIDGTTSGPNAFSGNIGKSLVNCEKRRTIQFAAIPSDITCDSVTLKDLSTDQKYLLEICRAVSDGICPEDLASRHPGKLSHSRWLTTANRILRLYISTDNANAELRILATYVAQVYAPMWFTIKQSPSCVNASRHLWKLIELSRCQPDKVKTVIHPVIQRNAYASHPENILLSMITDNRRHIRELGLRRVLKSRQHAIGGVREFVIPRLNFEANEYIDMIDWKKNKITDPPVLSQYTDEEISTFIQSDSSHVDIRKFPCHSQAVERCVKIVTEASEKVCGLESRNGFIAATLESRKVMPFFNTKCDYKVL